MNIEKQRAFIIRITYVAIILGLAYASIKYLLPLLMPFVIGFILAAIFRRLIDTIQKKLHIKRAIVSIFILIVFYGIIILLLALIGIKLFSFLKDLFYGMPDFYENTISPALVSANKKILEYFPDMQLNLEDMLNKVSDSLFSFITSASTTVLGAITDFAGQLPSFLIRMLFTIVASFFITIDYHRITRFIAKQFPEDKRELLQKLKDNGVGTLGKFFKAYAKLILITFIELSIGFLILRVPNPFLIGAIVAFIDILPILGTGAVLLPWSVISFILGNNTFGIGMLVLYIIVTIIRQTIEPKIVGQQIGLHPVITLLCMFVGAQLFGVIGLLLLPIIATIVKKLNDEGTIHLFK